MAKAQADRPTKRPALRWTAAGVLACAAAASLGYAGYWWWLNTPPGQPETLDEAHAMLTSARYANLPDSRKADYSAHLRTLMTSASDAERDAFVSAMRDNEEARRAMRDTMRQEMVTRARTWAVASDAEKEVMFDTFIAEMQRFREQMMAQRARMMAGNPEAERPAMTEEQAEAERQQRRAEMMSRVNERMQEMASSGNLQDGALVGKMIREMRDMAERRGMDLPRWGRGGGGGGGRPG